MEKYNKYLSYRQGQHPILLKMATWFIYLFIFIGVFHKFIANDQPILGSYNGSIVSPPISELVSDLGWSNNKYYDNSKFDWTLYPLIPYSASALNSSESNIGPFDPQKTTLYNRHWLGTDNLGRDVAAGIVHGANIAMKVGLFSILLALILGLYVGVISGYFGDDGWQSNIFQLVVGFAIKLLAIYYIIFPIVSKSQLSLSYYLLVILFFGLLLLLSQVYLGRLPIKKIKLPIDLFSSKVIEVVNSIPTLFMVLAMLALFSQPSIWNVILVIAILGWTKFARYTRAEMLQIKNLDFIQSAKSIGVTDWMIILKHALPNALTSVISITAFAISGAILLESTLSFLGIGIAVEQVSWGSMLAAARVDFNLWWLALFPGLAIFLVLFSFYILGNELQSKYR